MDISIKRTLKIGHCLCRFCAIQQRKKLRQYICRGFLVGAGGFASRGLKNSPQDCFLPSADGRPVRILPAPAQKRTRNLSCGSFLSECDKKDTLFFYSFGFRILDTSVTCRFSFFIQPFDFLLLLWNFNFLKFMCHWFLPQKPICNVMYILYIYNTPSYIVLYSFLLEL